MDSGTVEIVKRGRGRPRLSEVMAGNTSKNMETKSDVCGDASPCEVKKNEITNKEAEILVKLGISQINENEKSRRILECYLSLLLDKEITDDDAKTVVSVLNTATTSKHRQLCDKILSKYLVKFDSFLEIFRANLSEMPNGTQNGSQS